MARLSISQAWDETKRIFIRDGSLLTAVAGALLVLPNVIAGLVTPATDPASSSEGRVLTLIALFVGVVGQLAIVRLALGPSTTVGQAIGHGFRRFPVTFLAFLILGVIVFVMVIPAVVVLLALGLIDANGQTNGAGAIPVLLLVAAFLFIAVKFMLAVPVASAEPVGAIAILKRSWQLTRGHYWMLFGFELLLLILVVVMMYSAAAAGYVVANLIGGAVSPY
ncbi:MAG: hypothetical protein ABIW33_07730, partial [Sphingomicrobium sp.]